MHKTNDCRIYVSNSLSYSEEYADTTTNNIYILNKMHNARLARHHDQYNNEIDNTMECHAQTSIINNQRCIYAYHK